MILDEILLDNISNIAGIKTAPKSLDEIFCFFKNLKEKLETENYKSELIALVFFNFLTKKEIRDRKVTSRIFEDIMAKLFKGIVLDEESKENFPVPDYIKKYDDKHINSCKKFNFLISNDLSTNKREKADNKFGNYTLSLKTLKGQLYDSNLNIIDKDINSELNIGSLSYRALLVDLISDEELSKLSDRKGGLGSKKQLIKQIYTPLEKNSKWIDFIDRLNDFLNYIYDGSDFIIVFKSGYKMKILFIKEKDFIDELINIAKTDYSTFFDIFYRWENNNLRIHYNKLFKALKEKSKLREIELDFNTLEKSISLQEKISKIKLSIENILLKD